MAVGRRRSGALSTLPAASVRIRALARRSRQARVRVTALPGLALAGLVVGSLAAAALAAWVGVHVSSFVLDETLLKQSAVQYTRGLPGSLLHDLNARGTARLYSLVLSPLFGHLEGDVAVRAARGLNALLFVSAALPVYLLARRVLSSRSHAAAAAVLSVAVPWLAISTVLYTENLAYPLYMWTLWAVTGVLRRPAAGRDALAVALIVADTCTRVELAFLGPGYLLLVVARELAGAARPRWSVLTPGLVGRRMLSRYPLTLLLAIVAAGVVGVIFVQGRLHYEIQFVLGAYSAFQDRHTLPTDVLLAWLVEVVSLGLGVGLLPAVLGGCWYLGALSSGAERENRLLALVSLVLGASFVGEVIFAQSGFLGTVTEERYFIYLVPPLWVGTFAVLERRVAVSRERLGVAGVGMALLLATVPLSRPLDPDSAFLAPAATVVGHALTRLILLAGLAGISVRDVLAAAMLVASAGLYFGRRRARWRTRVIVGTAAAIQLAIAAYALATIDGQVPSVTGLTGGPIASLGWIDRHLPTGQRATWVQDEPAPDPRAFTDSQLTSLFWNNRIDEVAIVSAVGAPLVSAPLSTVALDMVSLDPASGRVSGALTRAAVTTPDSPFLQLSGRQLAASPDRRHVLQTLPVPAQATWASFGLTPEGWVSAPTPVHLAIFGAPTSAETVTLTLGPVPVTGPTQVALDIAGSTTVTEISPGPRHPMLSLAVCGSRPVTGVLSARHGLSLTAGGPAVAAALLAVHISALTGPAATTACHRRPMPVTGG